MKPILNYPGYFINKEGEIYSTKRRGRFKVKHDNHPICSSRFSTYIANVFIRTIRGATAFVLLNVDVDLHEGPVGFVPTLALFPIFSYNNL